MEKYWKDRSGLLNWGNLPQWHGPQQRQPLWSVGEGGEGR